MSASRKGSEFEKDVEQLLRLRGYSVARNSLISGTQLDLVAKREDELDNICLVVECADRQEPIGVPLVKEKASILLSLADSRYVFKLVFVSRSGFTAEAKAFAAVSSTITLLTSEDLESKLVNFQPYADWYLSNYDASVGVFREGNLKNSYVELACRDANGGIYPSLTERTLAWLADDENNLLFLLGEYGSGKTSFCRQLVYGLLEAKYRNQLSQRLTPILLNLREYRKATNIQQVVTDALMNLYGVAIPSFLAFERICSSGRVALILDGFDEMASLSDRQTVNECFQQVFLLAGLNAKVLVTCRSNFFRDHQEIVDLLGRFSIRVPYSEGTVNHLAELSFKGQGATLYVEKLDSDRIREFVERRFTKRAAEMLALIGSIHDLSDLSTRPVLLDLILKTLPELSKSGKSINSASLYQLYTDRWKARDEWRVCLDLDIRQAFCDALAWQLHCSGVQEIASEVLESLLVVSLSSGPESPEVIAHVRNDIQTCSFLVRVGTGNTFRFAHKSFLEFFVARKVVGDLRKERVPKPELGGRRPTGTNLFDSGFQPLDDQVVRAMSRELFTSNLSSTDKWGAFLSWRGSYSISDMTGFRAEWRSIDPQSYPSGAFGQFSEVFESQGLSGKAREMGLSEEIATFALELMDNDTVPVSSVLEQKDADVRSLVADMFRLAKANSYVGRNKELLQQYLSEGADERLKGALAAALARASVRFDSDEVVALRKVMSEMTWSYLLFELASAPDGYYRDIVETCSHIEGLETVNRVICYQGLRGRLSKEEQSLAGFGLVAELLASRSDREVRLGLALCESLESGVSGVTKSLVDVVARATGGEFGESCLSIATQARTLLLRSYQRGGKWQAVRQLWARESDEKRRRILMELEQQIRDVKSRQAMKLSWHEARAVTRLREELWGRLRP